LEEKLRTANGVEEKLPTNRAPTGNGVEEKLRNRGTRGDSRNVFTGKPLMDKQDK